MAAHVSPRPAEQERARVVGLLAQKVQAVIGQTVAPADVDQGSTGDPPAAEAAPGGSGWRVVKHPEAQRRLVLLPRRGVVERKLCLAGPRL
jgi:hypothetical protein